MASIDIATLLEPVSDEQPCGPSMVYDSAYLELDRSTRGTPEQQVGSTIVPAVEPNWKDVLKGSLELSRRTKDLRVLVFLCMALGKTEGLAGLRDGLALLKGTLERYWDTVHPQLDPEDNNDPIERLNILRVFASREEGGGDGPMVKLVREAPLSNSRQMGRFALRDIAVAMGQSAPANPAAPKVEMQVIEAALADTSTEYIQAAATAVAEAQELTKAVEAQVDGKVGAGRGINMGDFHGVLREVAQQLQACLARRGLAAMPVAAASGPAAGGGMPGEIQSPQDVIRLIDKICEFYTRTEPSSPVPLLLRRAQRLVSRSFWEIIQDLSPGAVDTIKTISGGEPTKPPG